MLIIVIPEDFRNDQYILKPLFKQLMQSIGKQNARVEICSDPLLGGIGEAMKSKRIEEFVDGYDGMIDVFILCVDRDGVSLRKTLGRSLRLGFSRA